ncbi:hypothetical protein [Actinotalea sp. K2]|uniref:hypothetical protein n=1 Tax=Actinotalea sp. K2 TaxID=2939438 RepID=UPI002017F8E0|nr:hypothetical protein [Actinotalea sp. K2]MCL3861297.1 hypothetical protein [Actinotalea sp. K2]
MTTGVAPSSTGSVVALAPRSSLRPVSTAQRVSPTASALVPWIAILTLVLLGMRQFLWSGLTSGYALAFLLAPVWLPVLRRYWGGRWLFALTALALVSGLWLTELASLDHRTSMSSLVGTTLMVLGTVCGVGVILWARLVTSDRVVGLAFGSGLAISELTGGDLASANPWKYAIAVPLALILLSLVNRPDRKGGQVAALMLLAAASALQDSRSYFATFLVAGLLTAWQMRPTISGRRSSAITVVVLMGIVGVTVYNLGTTLLVGGFLGEETQQRSIEQIDASGSVLTGGRPEIAASWALVQARPYGYGSGVAPNLDDILVAKTGMASIGYQPNNGYVENYMFGGEFKLHSIVGDFWSSFGIPGVLLASTVALLVVRGLSLALARRTASGIVVYLSCATLWNLAFSPLYGSIPSLMLTLGLVMTLREPTPASRPVPRPRPTSSHAAA